MQSRQGEGGGKCYKCKSARGIDLLQQITLINTPYLMTERDHDGILRTWCTSTARKVEEPKVGKMFQIRFVSSKRSRPLATFDIHDRLIIK